jgi:hypothetical protein
VIWKFDYAARALLFARCAIGLGVAAGAMATVSAFHGNWILATINGSLMAFKHWDGNGELLDARKVEGHRPRMK